MTSQYLLPCSCGKTVTVEMAQAGELVRCECGAELEVPTMRGLRQLKQVDVEVAETGPGWNIARGVVWLSLLVAGASFVIGIYLFFNPQKHPRTVADEELTKMSQKFDEFRNQLTLLKSLKKWENFRKRGLRSGPFENKVLSNAKRDYNLYLVRIWAAFIIGILGLLVAGGAQLVNRAKRKAITSTP